MSFVGVRVRAAAGEPGGQPFDGHLEVGVQVDEHLHLVGQPGEGDLLLAPPVGELLEPAVGSAKVHEVEQRQLVAEAFAD